MGPAAACEVLLQDVSPKRFQKPPASPMSLRVLTRVFVCPPTGNGVLGSFQGGAQAEGLPDGLVRRDQDLLREIGGE